VGEIRSRNEHQLMQRAHAAFRCTARSKRTGKRCRACGARVEGLPNAQRSRWRAEGQTERKLQTRARSMETIELWKRIKSLR
jgi:hypothetical protein